MDATIHKADLAVKIPPKCTTQTGIPYRKSRQRKRTDTLINTRIETRRISGEHWTAGCGGRIISGCAAHRRYFMQEERREPLFFILFFYSAIMP